MRLPVKGVTDPTEGAEDSRHAMRTRNTASEAIRLQHLVFNTDIQWEGIQKHNGTASNPNTRSRVTLWYIAAT